MPSGREHAALFHDQQHPFETQREADRGHLLLHEHADQVVVASAAAHRAGEARAR
jgi:hypothetical protein